MPDRLDKTIALTRLFLADAVRARIGWQFAAAGGLLVWIGLLLDRGIEPTPRERLIALLSLLVIGLLWGLIRCLPLMMYRPKEQELVGVIAKTHPELADSIIAATQVSVATSAVGKTTPNDQTIELHETNRQRINQALDSYDPRSAFRNPRSSLVARIATVAWVSALLFGLVFPSQASLYLKRLALSEEPWPRSVRLVPEGFTYDGSSDTWTKHFPRGTSVELAVWADLLGEAAPPETIRVKSLKFFEQKLADSMLRVGDPRSRGVSSKEQDSSSETSKAPRSQRYRLRLEELHQTLSLRLRGSDDQIIVQLIASDRPSIVSARLMVSPPSYLEQDAEEFDVAQLHALPEGSTIELLAMASKPLSNVTAVWQAEGDEAISLSTSANDLIANPNEIRFQANLQKKAGNISVELIDTQQIKSAQPFSLPIEILADEPPTIATYLDGIGKLITSNSIVPIIVTAKDDYGLVESYVLIEKVNDGPQTRTAKGLNSRGIDKSRENLYRRRVSFATEAAMSFSLTEQIDFELLSSAANNENRFATTVGDQLRLHAIASDAYDLAQRPPSLSEPRVLRVVSPEELLNHLNERERELRKTLEGVLADARRLAYSLERSVADTEETKASNRAGEWSLEVNKIIRDLESIVTRTRAIKNEILNNRLEQPALVDRLTDSVISPLRELLEEDLSAISKQLEQALQTSESALNHANLSARSAHSVRVIETVIEAMQANESYNEVVATLRQILRKQKQLNKQTEKEQRDETRRLLLD